MRIAVWHDLQSGGGKRALYDHVSGLVALGHHVESWCPPTADQEFLCLGDLVVEHVVPLADTPGTSLHHMADRIMKGSPGIRHVLRSMEEHARNCARDINAMSFDVLLSGSAARLGATGLARYVDCPSVLFLQEPFRALYEADPQLPWVAPPPPGLHPVQVVQRVREALRVGALRVQARQELEGARAYDQILVNSYFSRESVIRAYGIDAEVCYLGVDTKRYVDFGRERKRMVVGIGAFGRRKRIEIAIDAVAAISGPPDLVWIGDCTDERYLRGLVELAARRNVNFTPLVAVPQEHVVEVLNDAAAMLYAPRLEPFGYAPLEGGACGVPVVAKAEGGVRETVIDGETGFLMDNDRDLSIALERILEDFDLAAEMRKAARRNVESRWTLEAATERLESRLLAVL